MAEVQPQLVHKQFNSPIGLYSEQNIKETINREMKAVGGTGIDLDDQISSKPSHLAHSYVLKMLQEEESERYLGYKRVAWPPTPERKIIREFTPQPQSQGDINQTYTSSMPNANEQQLSSAMSINGHIQQPSGKEIYQNQLQGQQYPSQQQHHNQPSHYQTQNQNHVDQNNAHPQHHQQLQQQHQPDSQSNIPQQYYNSQGGQVGGGGHGGQPQYQPQQQQQQFQNHDQQQPHSGMVTLRKDPPYTQKPAPTVVSQPAAKSRRGGSVMRGDLKWPPQDCRERMAAEAELERQLELGPANRPTRMPKDYSGFFAKHALSHYYPGYKIPPGTQHMYIEF